MHTFYVCAFVVALLFISQTNGAKVVGHRVRTNTLDPACNCLAARNDFTYRYPEIVPLRKDPAYAYINYPNSSVTWNCNLCAVQPLLIAPISRCNCSEAVQRYETDYGVTAYHYQHYLDTWQSVGNWWHCELCVLTANQTCIEAKLNYGIRYPDTTYMDQAFHYITYGYWSNFTWDASLCNVTNRISAGTVNCTTARYIYRLYHNNSLWGEALTYNHYVKYSLVTGWSWAFNSCLAGNSTIGYYCDCWTARFLYWSNYPEIYALNIDASFHYKIAASSELYRRWDCDICKEQSTLDDLVFSTRCTCDKAFDMFVANYRSAITPPEMLNDPNKINLVFYFFTSNFAGNGYAWHCEVCETPFFNGQLSKTPKHLLLDATCVNARKSYTTRYPETANFDPVWHFENIGYYKELFWDSSQCISDTRYLDSPSCRDCYEAQQAYAAQYPIASRFQNPYNHWRGAYLFTAPRTYGYVYPCEQYCAILPTIAPTPTPPTTTGPGGAAMLTTSVTSSTAITTITTTTTGGASTTSATTEQPSTSTGGGVVVVGSSSGTGGIVPAVGSTSTGGQSPTTGSKVEPPTTGDKGKSAALSTTEVLAIVVPIVAVLSVGLGMLFIHQQRRQAVQALIKAEEGERRNYKIDFNSLSVDWLIGSGSFGHVYRGEYRGADVAIKKLKKQNMGNKQLEDFAKEAMVMVGLRHPNIVLFMGVCLERPELCIVTEYMPRGNLYDVLHDNSIKLSFSVLKTMALHVVKGLQFIHSAQMIHRDLKSPNLLVDANWTIKIADFGLSCAKSQVTEDAQISLLWTAPEILMREKNCYSEKSDVYSFGVILWELMSRQTPFSEYTAAAIAPVIVLGKRPAVVPEWNAAMKILMSNCWGQLPSHRPTVRDVRIALESIRDDNSETGINTPPSLHSSVSSGSPSYGEREMAQLVNTPPRGYLTLVFTDVEGSVSLWEADPSTMLISLRLHNGILRKLLKQHGGYEAKTEGDAFMLAFTDDVAAVNFCVAAQLALMKADWPDAILRQPSAKEEWTDQGTCLFRGLRVRMGVHSGEPQIEQDQITGKTEYFGQMVSVASRVSSNAVGGQIIITSEVYSRIANNLPKLDPCVVEQVGPVQVKGMQEPMLLYQVWPRDMKMRGAHPVLDLTTHQAGSWSRYGSEVSSNSDQDSYEWSLRHNEKWIINYEDLELDVVIGNGSFGDVFAGKWKGQPVAIKQFMKQKINDEVLLEMRTESGILSAIEHPNIIKFLGMCIKIPHLCIVTELLDRGSLSTILLGNESISWSQKKNFATDIAKGMEYLHKNNIIHRDVKSPNMLVAGDWTVKIGDFGFSRVKAENHTMTQCGTVAWTAPEIFLGDRYSEKADVYSYSVILWELIFRKKPWQGLNSMKVCHAVENGERLPLQNLPSGTPEYFIKLMEACWLQDHEARPSFTEVLQFLDLH